MKEEISELHSFMRRLEKKSNEMFKELKSNMNNSFGSNIDDITLEDKIEQKVEILQKKNKKYIDKVINELKIMLKNNQRETISFDGKYSSNDLDRSNSKSRLHQLKNSQKVLKASQLRYE